MVRKMHTPILALVFATALAIGAAAFAQDEGESVYHSNCVGCHQANGEGVPGAFPPLAKGHIPDILAAEGGRTYLIDVMLYGLVGEIRVLGNTYNNAMPAWAQLSNEQIAAVLNYIATAWENEPHEEFEPYEAAEIEEERGKDLSSADVHDIRQELPLGESE